MTNYTETTAVEFDFGHQNRNYQALVDTGLKFGKVEYRYIEPEAGVGCYYNEQYKRRHGKYPPRRLTFKAHTFDNKIVWHKYEAPSIGGGRNYLIIDGKHINVTSYLKEHSEKGQAAGENFFEN